MAIYITGDIHGNVTRFSVENFYEQKEMNKNDTVIILGDFGLVWNKDGEDKNEKNWLDWLESKPFTTVFVDGNHENFKRLYTYPIKKWHDGRVHEIRPHVLHLMRGEIFDIEGLSFFTFGGASSHDIQDGILEFDGWREKAKELDKYGKYMYRVKDLSWWKEELPTEEEMQHGLETLKRHDNKVDFLLTHSPSTSELTLMGGKGLYEPDILTDYLEKIKAECDYKKHLFGHMHVNRAINEMDICLYEQIIRVN